MRFWSLWRIWNRFRWKRNKLRVSEKATNAHGERNILPRCEISRWEFSDEKWVAVLIRTGTAPVAIHGNIRLSRTSCSLHPVFQHFSRKYHHLPTNIFGRTFRPPWAFCVLKIPWKTSKPNSCYWFLYSSKVIHILNSCFQILYMCFLKRFTYLFSILAYYACVFPVIIHAGSLFFALKHVFSDLLYLPNSCFELSACVSSFFAHT